MSSLGLGPAAKPEEAAAPAPTPALDSEAPADPAVKVPVPLLFQGHLHCSFALARGLFPLQHNELPM